MKRACLILAHNEFELLQRLVSALDDAGNDIFVHFDRKVPRLPALTAAHSRLFILKNRVDVRWGTVSMIKAEYALFEEACRTGRYQHYLLLSGTHFPLAGNERIASFLEAHHGQSLFPYMEAANDYQVDMKMRRINVMPGTMFWRAFLKVQKMLGIRIHAGCRFHNAGQWACLSDEAVRYLVSRKKSIMRKYRFSFCGDEFFAPTELMASSMADAVVFSHGLLKFDIGRANARTYTLEDYDELTASGCLFARKLTGEHMDLVDKLISARGK